MKKMFLRAVTAMAAVTALLTMVLGAQLRVSASAAIVLDADSGRVLWSKNADKRALIASTTKIMTALIVVQNCDLKERVTVHNEAIGVEGSSIWLKPDEEITVEALLYGMMLHSGNDAAAALAFHCAGSIEGFAEMMNSKSLELGLRNTHFSNPHGLDAEEHYSTAYDLAKLTVYALREPAFMDVVSTKTISIGGRTFTNHNKLLWKYDGAIGVKTGYTKAAGRILVSAAEREDRRLIVVTIDAPDDWNDHCSLFDYGFETYRWHHVIDAGAAVAVVPVVSGAADYAAVATRNKIYYPVRTNEKLTIELDVPALVEPPVIAGNKAGELLILIDGMQVYNVPLYWQQTVMERA